MVWIWSDGLSHNTTYDLAVFSGDLGWHFDGFTNSIVTEVPFDGQLVVRTFDHLDRDNNPDDLGLYEGFISRSGMPGPAGWLSPGNQ